MSCYGYFRPTTPNLEALASHATRFNRATTPMPFTAPAHCSMMTGLYPTTHGVTENCITLPDAVPCLADMLTQQGYATAAVVAVRFLSEFGLDRGFDWVDREFGENTVRRGDEVTSRAITWLGKRRPPKPFFLWAHYYDPHEPYRPPARFQPLLPDEIPADEAGREALAHRLQAELRAEQPPFNKQAPHAYLLDQYAYDGEIQFADEQIGALLDHLRRYGLYDSSLIIVVGDHGEAFGEHPGDIQHGFRLYQATQRVPLLIKLPGQTQARQVDAVVSLVDLLPTIVDILEMPDLSHVQGLSLLPLLEGDPPEPSFVQRTVFMERRRNKVSASGPAREVRPEHRCFDNEMYAVQSGRWKLIWENGARPELYDLASDPSEQRNLAEQYPKRVAHLRGWMRDQHARNRQQATAVAGPADDPETLRMLRGLGYIGLNVPFELITADDPEPDD